MSPREIAEGVDDAPPWICDECGELVVLAGHCPRCTKAPDDTGEHVVVREDDGETD